MYTKHFGLKYKPFSAAPDPRFLWLNEDQKRELAFLRHALLEQSGFALITGDVGTGKTMLAKGLAESISKAASVVYVPDPDMEKLDFFNFVADGLGLERYFESKADFLISLKRRLSRSDSDSRKIVLIIDEAHRLSHDILQEIRLLSSLETGGRMQLGTVLVGLPVVEEILREDQNRNVMQRITSSIHLAPLTQESTKSYVIYRLRKGGAAQGIFTAPALEQIYFFSGGNPRLINLLCDHALVTGYAAEKRTIDAKIVQECVTDLDISFSDATPDSGVPEAAPEDSPEVHETESIETGSESPSFSPKHLARMRNFAVALTTVILTFVAGYFLMDRFFDQPSSEADNQEAVQEIVRILESQPERQDTIYFSERTFGHEMGDESDDYDTAAERLSADANDFNPKKIRKKIEVPAAEKIESPEGLNF